MPWSAVNLEAGTVSVDRTLLKPGIRADPSAEAADGRRYEIQHLSIGLQAPAISGTPRNGRRANSLESFRGKPIVVVFWGST